MFKDLENLIHAAMIIICSVFLIVGFKLTIIGQAIAIAISYLILYIFNFKEKKEILIVIIAFVFLGNIIYFVYDSINFSVAIDYIKANFNLTLIR